MSRGHGTIGILDHGAWAVRVAVAGFAYRRYQGSLSDVTAFRLGVGRLAPVRQLNEAVLVSDYVLQMPLLLGTGITE
jgi:hypothetical protein